MARVSPCLGLFLRIWSAALIPGRRGQHLPAGLRTLLPTFLVLLVLIVPYHGAEERLLLCAEGLRHGFSLVEEASRFGGVCETAEENDKLKTVQITFVNLRRGTEGTVQRTADSRPFFGAGASGAVEEVARRQVEDDSKLVARFSNLGSRFFLSRPGTEAVALAIDVESFPTQDLQIQDIQDTQYIQYIQHIQHTAHTAHSTYSTHSTHSTYSMYPPRTPQRGPPPILQPHQRHLMHLEGQSRYLQSRHARSVAPCPT